MKRLHEIVSQSCNEFKNRLEILDSKGGGLTKERYIKYLSMQYHLTNGVQRHFMTCASHPDMARRPKLREFLVHFAIEEELHYKIAEKDLSNMDCKPLPLCLDVELWWAYFNSVVFDRPFLRLGATCILENLSSPSSEVIDRLFKAATYLTPNNTKFMQIHRHGDKLPHGDQILEALENAHLEEKHILDLIQGAQTGWTIYSRMADWALE